MTKRYLLLAAERLPDRSRGLAPAPFASACSRRTSRFTVSSATVRLGDRFAAPQHRVAVSKEQRSAMAALVQRTRLLAVGAIALLGGACDTVEPLSSEPPQVSVYSGRNELAFEQFIQAVSDRVPAFGGYSYSNGELSIYIQDVARGEAARAALSGVISRDPLLAAARVTYKAVPRSARELHAVKESLANVLGITGTVLIGVDYRRNSVIIGVVDAVAAEAVETYAASIRIPSGAFLVEEIPPFVEHQQIDQHSRPLAAGLAVQGKGMAGPCTMGPIVRRGSDASTYYALVPSHCTHSAGGVVPATEFFQMDTLNSFHYIGREWLDPTWRALPGCPSNRVCRYSDAALVRLEVDALERNFGHIVNLSSPGAWGTPLTRYYPDLAITHWYTIPYAPPYAGMPVSKVGKSGGWSYGEVTIPCANANSSTSNRTVICAVVADYHNLPGDSGGPVWRHISPWDTSFILLYGTHFGGTGTQAAFSSWDGIELDFATSLWPK